MTFGFVGLGGLRGGFLVGGGENGGFFAVGDGGHRHRHSVRFFDRAAGSLGDGDGELSELLNRKRVGHLAVFGFRDGRCIGHAPFLWLSGRHGSGGEVL